MFVHWLIVGLLLTTNGLEDQDDEWIDPHDMLHYDAATGRMIKPQPTRSEQDSDTSTITPEDSVEIEGSDVPCAEFSCCNRQLEKLQNEKQTVEEFKKKSSADSMETSCNPVFKRYLNKLLLEVGKLRLPDDYNNELHYDADVFITKQDVAEIKKFLSNENWKAGAMDDALSKILINFKNHDPDIWKWRFEDTFGVDSMTVFLLSASFACVALIITTELWTIISPLTQLVRFFVLCFFVSVVWNWVYLYKIAFAQRHADIVKLEDDKSLCTGLQRMDWKGSLSQWFLRIWTIHEDPCEKYYEVLLVNPIFEVPPTKALALTLTSFFIEPFNHIGEPISRFLRDILKDLPWMLQIMVCLVLIVSIAAFCYSSGHAVVQYGLMRQFPGMGHQGQPPAPVMYHNVPYGANYAYQPGGGYVDYQAGGDAAHMPMLRRGGSQVHDPATFPRLNIPRDLDQQWVGHAYQHDRNVTYERVAMPDNGKSGDQLRRRKVADRLPPEVLEELGPSQRRTVYRAQPPARAAQYSTNDFFDGNCEEPEAGDLQTKPEAGVNNDNEAVSDQGKPEQKNTQEQTGQGPERFKTNDAPNAKISSSPSGGRAVDTQASNKGNMSGREPEIQVTALENIGMKESKNAESGTNLEHDVKTSIQETESETTAT
uniref:Chloride channel CLIC-like protein 1 n=1 Tax=Callorhinchus milii TaxID=7868 RepID=V9KJ40_CALMI